MATAHLGSPMNGLTLRKERRRSSPRLQVLRKTQKAIGSMMGSLRISPRSTRSTPRSRNILAPISFDALPSRDGNATQQLSSPSATLESTITMLSNSSLEENRKGLQSLLLLTKLNHLVSSPRTDVSYRLIFGGPDRTAGRVRKLLLSFLCDGVEVSSASLEQENDDQSDISAISDDKCFAEMPNDNWEDMFDSEDEAENTSGRHRGVLQCTTLQIVANCLDHVASPSRSSMSESKSIDFGQEFWEKLIQTLSTNIELGNDANVSGYSLRCLRLLARLESATVTPLLQYTLLPFIMNLKDDGASQNHSMIQDESEKLLKLLL